jgi:hypothetical protein
MLDHYLPRCPQVCISLRLLRVHIDSFRIFWDNFVYHKQLKICRILHIRLNTFSVLSEYAERMKITHKEIFTFNNSWGL